MCDYSLHNVASRPARVGDKLITTRFPNSVTRGFATVEEPNVAVCLRPGTELAFEREVECEAGYGLLPNKKYGEKVAIFRELNRGLLDAHHDALEFPSGQSVLVTRLIEGQRATVLQLPAMPHEARPEREREERARDTLIA
jgi:hypothetical protein